MFLCEVQSVRCGMETWVTPQLLTRQRPRLSLKSMAHWRPCMCVCLFRHLPMRVYKLQQRGICWTEPSFSSDCLTACPRGLLENLKNRGLIVFQSPHARPFGEYARYAARVCVLRRKQRWQRFNRSWSQVQARIDSCLAGVNSNVFNSLGAHIKSTGRKMPRVGDYIPVALVRLWCDAKLFNFFAELKTLRV